MVDMSRIDLFIDRSKKLSILGREWSGSFVSYPCQGQGVWVGQSGWTAGLACQARGGGIQGLNGDVT